jgi:hypothetical protein
VSVLNHGTLGNWDDLITSRVRLEQGSGTGLGLYQPYSTIHHTPTIHVRHYTYTSHSCASAAYFYTFRQYYPSGDCFCVLGTRAVYKIGFQKKKKKSRRPHLGIFYSSTEYATMSVLKAAQNANTAFSEIPIMSAHSTHT